MTEYRDLKTTILEGLDLPVGEFRLLTVISPEEPHGAQLLLEPDAILPLTRIRTPSMKPAFLSPHSPCMTFKENFKGYQLWD